jgi:3-phenylpropionate/trans-cinnamate dioxygenase ferredoxin reductase component
VSSSGLAGSLRQFDSVVVGTGIAAVSAVDAMRTAGHHGSVLMVGDEPELPYRRPTVSKELVRGAKRPDQVRIKPEAWYVENDVTLRTGVRVTSVDLDGRRVLLADGSSVNYGQLLLATGGRARSPWSGPRVVTLRGVADAARLTTALSGVTQVVVVGAGLVGSEIAASLRALDREVTLLETAPLPLPRLLPPDLAHRYVALHSDRGTKLETDVEVTDVSENPDGVVVSAADGRRWEAGLVVVAIGMEPHLELAPGLEVDGGIVVDWRGETSVRGVFAAGDVAVRPSSYVDGRLRAEHWQSAQNHGAAVGRAMAGEEVRFDEVPWSWSEQYGVNLQVTGWPDPTDHLVVRGDLDGDSFTAFYLREGVLRGAVTIGRPADVRAARALIAARARVSAARLSDLSVGVDETVEG